MKTGKPTQTLPLIALIAVCLSLGCNTKETDAVAQAVPQADAARKQTPAKATHKKHPANHLARESSPYLLLHAHNPVDWYPWGPEAFAKARKEKKPIFLSIGYSSCYWCHVMERLVFEDEKIAAYMNEHFVNIKVDREERPDIDEIYMTSLYVYLRQIGSRQGGGWPMSMFLTPAAKPFAGGTYFPPEDDRGRPGFLTVLKQISKLWKNEPKQLEQNADLITKFVQQAMKPRLTLTPVELNRSLVGRATEAVASSFDEKFGGVGFNAASPNSPKFPTPAKLALLQYDSRRNGDERSAQIVRETLDRMAAGGIRDHLGGGFHRYSTDRFWHVPHFEKMLYDQAQLAVVYTEAFRQTGEPKYRAIAEDIFRYVAGEMTDTAGGFYSALDAETDGIEGEFYVWSKKEIVKILGADDAQLFQSIYGMEEANPFEHGYVLHLPASIADAAEKLKVPPAQLEQRLHLMRFQLLIVRAKRAPLLKDDKSLTSWNGMMIRAYARAGLVFDDAEYIKTAEKAAMFVLAHMRDKEQRLQRTYRGGTAKLNAYLDDYALLVEGLLTIYEATANEKWLNASRRLTDQQIDLFWDKTGKGFFFTSRDHEELIVRTKGANDSAVPSGNGVSVRNLIRLASLTGQEKYRTYAKETLEAFAPAIDRAPQGMVTIALALGEYLDKPNFAATRKTSATDSKAAPTENRQNGLGSAVESPQTSQSSPIQLTAGESEKKPARKPELATTRAFLSVDKLPPGGRCKIVVFVDIKEGWHINANPANPNFLIPTVLSVKSKLGCKLTSISYEPGKKVEVPGSPTLHVYETKTAIRGVLEIPASAVGKTDEIEILVRYQPCNDTKCLPPKTARLTGKVTIARSATEVKQINANLFPKPQPKKSLNR
jgi:uncharacterized protein YyaL (SSP411 family)